MLTLAIDTATKVCSVALCRDGEIIAEYSIHMGMTHSEGLLPQLEQLLKRTNTKKQDIDLIAVSMGPGSFTGLRIGLFNTSAEPKKIGFTPRTLGLWSNKITIRDVWRQQDVAEIGPRDRYEQEVAPHGAALLLVSPPNTLEKIVHKPYIIKR